MNRSFRYISSHAKDAAQKLILIPRILIFMPMDKILDPRVSNNIESYADAHAKMHNKSSLRMLFNESDMSWIMLMTFYCEEADAKPLLYFSAIAGAAFGSIHCAAWNFGFPSHVEQIMWRTASLILVGICLSIFLGGPVMKFIQVRLKRRRHWRPYFFFREFAFIPTVIYSASRLTILILALLSLRDLPNSSLQNVMWTKFIPHI